jgi:AraC-like DNA-binding protein
MPPAADEGRRLVAEALARSFAFRLHGCGVTPVGPGHTTGWRTLPGCTTAQLVGTQATLERDGVAPLIVRAGEAFCAAPMLHHRSSISGGEGLSRWAHFTCTIFGAIDLMSLADLPVHWQGAEATAIGQLAARLTGTLAGGGDDIHRALSSHAIAFELVASLFARAPLLPRARVLLTNASRLAPVLEHIEANLAQPFTRVGLARRARLSPSRFSALFFEAIGLAPLAFLAQRRCQQAQQLLIASQLTVQEVGLAVGVTDAFYFSRWFRSRVGLSPLRYREQVRAGLAGAAMG